MTEIALHKSIIVLCLVEKNVCMWFTGRNIVQMSFLTSVYAVKKRKKTRAASIYTSDFFIQPMK
jgi:hypothetical protein